jgi:hypothetical protein
MDEGAHRCETSLFLFRPICNHRSSRPLERARLTPDEQQALFKAVEEGLAQEKAGLPAVIAPTAPLVATTFDQALAEMNAQHAVIEAVGRKTVIATVKPGMFERTEIVFQAVSDFELWYRNKTISIAVSGRRGTQTIPISKATWWLEQAGRREYHGVTFCPGGGVEVNGHLNLWQGWGIEEKQGNWRPILAHIVHVICDGNRVFAQYLVRWIAWSVQNPALQAEVLVALIGGKGTGKGTLGHVLQLMFRPHTFKVTSSDQVVGRFNAHLQECVLLIVDEALGR